MFPLQELKQQWQDKLFQKVGAIFTLVTEISNRWLVINVNASLFSKVLRETR